jgi:hypothetical protein
VLVAWNAAFVVWVVISAGQVTHVGKFVIVSGMSYNELISYIWFGGLIVLSVIWATTRKDRRRKTRGTP